MSITNTKEAALAAKKSLLALLTVAAEEGNFSIAHSALSTLQIIEPVAQAADPFGMNGEEKAWIHSGNIIMAIKAIRARLSNTLREAKDMAENYREHLYSTGELKRPEVVNYF